MICFDAGVGFAAARASPNRNSNSVQVAANTSRRNEPPSTPAVATMPARPDTARSDKSITPAGGSVSPKPNGFLRMRNLIGKRSTTNLDQSRSTSVQDISGFRMVPAQFSVPRSHSRIAEMWSVDNLIDRWIERSIGTSTPRFFTLQLKKSLFQ